MSVSCSLFLCVGAFFELFIVIHYFVFNIRYFALILVFSAIYEFHMSSISLWHLSEDFIFLSNLSFKFWTALVNSFSLLPTSLKFTMTIIEWSCCELVVISCLNSSIVCIPSDFRFLPPGVYFLLLLWPPALSWENWENLDTFASIYTYASPGLWGYLLQVGEEEVRRVCAFYGDLF